MTNIVDEQDESLIFFLSLKFSIRFVAWEEVLTMRRDFKEDCITAELFKGNAEPLVSGYYVNMSFSRNPNGSLINPFRLSAIKSLRTNKVYYYTISAPFISRITLDIARNSQEFQRGAIR